MFYWSCTRVRDSLYPNFDPSHFAPIAITSKLSESCRIYQIQSYGAKDSVKNVIDLKGFSLNDFHPKLKFVFADYYTKSGARFSLYDTWHFVPIGVTSKLSEPCRINRNHSVPIRLIPWEQFGIIDCKKTMKIGFSAKKTSNSINFLKGSLVSQNLFICEKVSRSNKAWPPLV